MSHRTSYFALLFIFFLVFNIVRAGADDRLIDNGDGTVTDLKSGLMWAKTDNQFDILWQQAKDWTHSDFPKTISRKYKNWRLPTLTELKTLYVEDVNFDGYPTDCGYRVKIVPQIQLSCTIIWSSETALVSPLAFNFYIGSAFGIDVHINKGCRVLPVRNLK